MKRKEWQIFHGISNEKMAKIAHVLVVFGGVGKNAKITKVWDVRVEGRWGLADRMTKHDKTNKHSVMTQIIGNIDGYVKTDKMT